MVISIPTSPQVEVSATPNPDCSHYQMLIFLLIVQKIDSFYFEGLKTASHFITDPLHQLRKPLKLQRLKQFGNYHTILIKLAQQLH
jgi:hypothetical protein